jgi:DNA polymerase-3 subunit gamma/tau
MLLSQNSQVVGIEANVLTLGFKTAGARESFLQGGSDQILRQAMIDLIGADWRIEAVVDPSADPVKAAAPRVIKPAVVDAPPASPAAASRPPAPAPPPEAAQGPEAEPIDPDDYVDPADPTISNEAESGAALLARELGATVIEEIPHDK